MDIDFNIENYNLNDILNLFQVQHDFNEIDLKKVASSCTQPKKQCRKKLEEEREMKKVYRKSSPVSQLHFTSWKKTLR